MYIKNYDTDVEKCKKYGEEGEVIFVRRTSDFP